MSPLGGAVGTVIISILHQHESEALDLMNAVLQSFAAGTFMYITFFEILVKSVATSTGTRSTYASLVRLCAVVVGFSTMAGLAFLH